MKNELNNDELMKEVREYDEATSKIIEEEKINGKAKRLEMDMKFRIIFGSLCFIVLAITLYRYLRK